jgi:hypothetical protein
MYCYMHASTSGCGLFCLRADTDTTAVNATAPMLCVPVLQEGDSDEVAFCKQIAHKDLMAIFGGKKVHFCIQNQLLYCSILHQLALHEHYYCLYCSTLQLLLLLLLR